MKKRLFQIACVIFLISYLASLISNKDSSNVIPASDESRKNAIETLQLYQNVDSQLIAERNELYLLMLKHTVPYEEPSEADKSYFLRNITHIDSVVNTCVEFIHQNKEDELISLLETELQNFYAHPHNNVDNEMALHYLIEELYSRHCTSTEEFFAKVIPLAEWSVMHIETMENGHSAYSLALTELVLLYTWSGNYDKAILNGKKLSAYASQRGDEEALIYSSSLLSEIYNKIGQKAKSDSCINGVKDLPRFNKIHEEVKGNLSDLIDLDK